MAEAEKRENLTEQMSEITAIQTENVKENLEKTIRAVGYIAWGYILIHLNVNIGTLNILPNWLGYLLVVAALPLLSGEVSSILLLRPLGIALTVWEAILWVLALIGITQSFYLLNVIAGVLFLYFHFQLLTNLAEAAGYWGCPQEGLLKLRAVQTVFMTILYFLLCFPTLWEKYEQIPLLLLAANIIVTIWICGTLFRLKGLLRGIDVEEDAE